MLRHIDLFRYNSFQRVFPLSEPFPHLFKVLFTLFFYVTERESHLIFHKFHLFTEFSNGFLLFLLAMSWQLSIRLFVMIVNLITELLSHSKVVIVIVVPEHRSNSLPFFFLFNAAFPAAAAMTSMLIIDLSSTIFLERPRTWLMIRGAFVNDILLVLTTCGP